MVCCAPSLKTASALISLSEEVSEAESRVARNGARPMQNLRETVGRYTDLSRQFRRAHTECFQFFGQVLTWMDSSKSHGDITAAHKSALK